MKKLMKKSMLPMLALSAVAFMAVSCSNGGSNYTAYNSEELGSPKDLTATVTWWNNYVVPEIGDKLTEEAARKKSTYSEYYFAKDAIVEFNKLYPNIKVEPTYKGSYSEIQTAVNTALNSGDTPSIASCYADHVAGYKKAGASLDMTGYIDDATIGLGLGNDGKTTDATTAKADYNQSYLSNESGMYKEKAFYSLPYSKSGETMVINKSVFDKVGAGECGTTTKDDYTNYSAPVAAASKTAYAVPKNWTDLMATATKMKTDFATIFNGNTEAAANDGGQYDADGYFKAVPVCYDSAENMYITFCDMLGIPYTSNESDEVAKQVLFNNADAKKLLVQLKKWNNEGLLATQNQLYITNAAKGYHQYSSTLVAQGKCMVAFSSTAGATYFATNSSFQAQLNETPTIDKSIYGTGTGSTAKSHVMSQGPSLTFFKKKDAKEQYASWIFYKFLTNSLNTANLSVAKSYFPLRASSYNSDTIKAMTDLAGTTTIESSYNDKKKDYTGQVLKLNTTYTNDNRYVSSPVFDYSSSCRTAVGNIVTTIFNDKTIKTEAQITAAVEKAFSDAYKAVVTA